ncbi:MAG: AraC family transcriptional regulator, partial [Actinomycetia bacterium]|nr:AraC family transcriptional regulator [Actinomycetes bacterium]
MPPVYRADLWRRHVTANHGRLDFAFATAAGFVGGTKVQRCGDVQLVEFWSDAVRYVRQPHFADRDADDGLRLLVPLSGELLVRGPNSDRRVSPGVAAAVSMGRGFELEQQRRARALILSIPSRLWEAAPPGDPSVWSLDHGSGAVFGAALQEIAAQRARLDADSFVRACAFAALLVADSGSDEVDLAARARTLVRQYSDDADFDPAVLAQRLGWSLRSIQVALRRAGTTPADLIRTQRLERAAARL